MDDRPPVVVVGAGASGLAAIKSCLEQGLKVVCFERTDQIGGLWRFREGVLDGVASVMRSTVINSSKEMSAYSDFPPPAHFANFMHNKQQVEYFDLYAEKFDLRRHIQFNHRIQSIEQTEDFAHTGRWMVRVEDLVSGTESQMLASAVMVCSGHHSCPHVPEFPGLSEFKGEVRHAHTYKDYRGFENKRVVVVGIGNSGGDIAVELSRIASKVYLSTRSGTWVMNRVGIGGFPMDYVFLRRFVVGPTSLIPFKVYEYGAEFLHMLRFDHTLYNLKPKHRFFSQHPMVNDTLPNCMLSGTVIVKNDVHGFSEDGVVFEGEEGKAPYPIDAVILATGYKITFPFLDERVVRVQRNEVELYKYVFPPDLRPSTLAVIGLIQPLGSIVPIAELQSRWATRVFGGMLVLPAKVEMDEDIRRMRKTVKEKFGTSQRHTIQVDYMTYMDDVGQLLGVKPNLRRLFFSDPIFWIYCMFGANLPYQYRLQGPHPWSGARQAILESNERVRAPLQTRAKVSMAPPEPSKFRVTFQEKMNKGLWAYIITAFGIVTFVLCFALV